MSIACRTARQAKKLLVVRGGGGGPLLRPEPPKQPLAEQDELYVPFLPVTPNWCF